MRAQAVCVFSTGLVWSCDSCTVDEEFVIFLQLLLFFAI